MSACTRTRSPTQRLMGNFPLSTWGWTLSMTTRRSVLTVRLIRVAGVSNASSPKEACPGKWLGSQVGCATRGAQTPSQLYIGPRLRFTQRAWACALVHSCNGRAYSPYGTQMFFTWVAWCRNHRPSPCPMLNQSIARPSSLKTCFRFPTDNDVATALLASPANDQKAATSSCSAKTFSNSALRPETMLTTPPGKSLVSITYYKSPIMSG